MVGQNYGLSSAGYIVRILIPGAFPSILTGLKVGWAFAWRTLIAAELVFGVSSGSGGLGWYIFENKNQLRIPEVFAGLLTVIIFGLFVENVIFRTIEQPHGAPLGHADLTNPSDRRTNAAPSGARSRAVRFGSVGDRDVAAQPTRTYSRRCRKHRARAAPPATAGRAPASRPTLRR